MSTGYAIEVAALPTHGGDTDSIKGTDKKRMHSGELSRSTQQVPELCDPEASALAETRSARALAGCPL